MGAPIPLAGRETVRRAIHEHFESRDRASRDIIVDAYQGLAYSLATRFAQRGVELDDLNQVALIGLLKAVERYDPNRGVELTTLATATILGELKRHLKLSRRLFVESSKASRQKFIEYLEQAKKAQATLRE